MILFFICIVGLFLSVDFLIKAIKNKYGFGIGFNILSIVILFVTLASVFIK